ncbi:AaceriAEL184Wp [[Ashbya] aceris (nom. inval.)]|nr:AaceriAEL184Wp [[Ashbya] aceris (nom. inval.)]
MSVEQVFRACTYEEQVARFERNVEAAERRSAAEDKALVIYSGGDDDEWLLRWFGPVLAESVGDKCVWLRVTAGSAGAAQVRTRYGVGGAPGVWCVRDGQVVLGLQGQSGCPGFARRLLRSLDGQTTCELAFKLTDGGLLRHEFSAETTLGLVRAWVDAHRNDGTLPYQFYSSAQRATLTEAQEQLTLTELDLAPRSALILKPVQMAAAEAVGEAPGGGLLSSLRRAVAWLVTRPAPAAAAPAADTASPSPASSCYASPMQSPLLKHFDCSGSELNIPPSCIAPSARKFQSPDRR